MFLRFLLPFCTADAWQCKRFDVDNDNKQFAALCQWIVMSAISSAQLRLLRHPTHVRATVVCVCLSVPEWFSTRPLYNTSTKTFFAVIYEFVSSSMFRFCRWYESMPPTTTMCATADANQIAKIRIRFRKRVAKLIQLNDVSQSTLCICRTEISSIESCCVVLFLRCCCSWWIAFANCSR